MRVRDDVTSLVGLQHSLAIFQDIRHTEFSVFDSSVWTSHPFFR